jgi:DNA polymerase III epsilon subunit-like protein
MAYIVDRVVICDAHHLCDEVRGWREASYRFHGCPALCSLRLARHTLGICPINLAFVCERLGIPLSHHDQLSDAEAAAGIMLTAMERTA